MMLSTKRKPKMKLGNLFKKDLIKKLQCSNTESKDICALEANRMILRINSSGNGIGFGTDTRKIRRRRHHVVSQFIAENKNAHTQDIGMWHDGSEGATSTSTSTSEESTSQPTSADADSNDSQTSFVDRPKTVSFSYPLVTKVKIVARYQFRRTEEPPRSYLCDEATLHYSHADETPTHPHYDISELLNAQAKQRAFLDDHELRQVLRQKHRLIKFRRKLTKQRRKARMERTRIKLALATAALEKVGQIQQRKINQYKMAAPNAQEHRYRRGVKYGLAYAARKVVLVQRRQRFLNSIVQAALARSAHRQTITAMSDAMRPTSPIRRQMRRIWAHQAMTKAMVRQFNMNLVNQVTTSEPLIVGFSKAQKGKQGDNDSDNDEDEDQDEDDDEDDLDTNDFQFRRLEWAVLSFLAAAKSRSRRLVEV